MHKGKTVFRCTVLFVVAALAASAQPSDKGQVLEAIFSDYEVIQLDPGEVERQVKQYREPLTVEIAGTRFVFELEPRDLRSPRYRAEATDDDGLRRPIQDPEVSTFKGTAVGAPDIQGRFTITKDSFDGVIFTPGDWLYIEPVKNYHPDSEDSEMVAYRHSDITHDVPLSCGTSSLHHFQEQGAAKIELPEPRAIDYSTTYTAEVATEADIEFVRVSGGGRAANRKIMSILNRVEGVYERELRLKIEVTYQHVWETSRDPYNKTDMSELLDQFQDHWNENFFHVDYDLAHMWTGRPDADGAGIAWIGPVCRNRRFGYGISKHYRNAPSVVAHIIAAHEIGHNFGADHPNEEDPPIRACDATIMEATDWEPIPTMTFCQFSRREIRTHTSLFNSCFPEAAPPPPPPPPPAVTINTPTNLTAEAINSTMVRLEWQDNSANEILFAIERRNAGENWTSYLEAAVAQNRTAYIDLEITPATTYVYRVYALGSGTGSYSDYSNTAAVTTPRAGTAEDKPCGDQKVLDVQFTLRAVKHPTYFAGDPRFRVEVPADATGLLVSLKSLTPDADVDLHVNHGSYAKLVDGRPAADHSSESYTGSEAIHVTSTSDPPLQTGTYYFSISLHTTGKQVRVNLSAKLEY